MKSWEMPIPEIKHIGIDPLKLSGIPTVGKHRFSIAQLIAELSDGERNLQEIAENFEMPFESLSGCLNELAVILDRSFADKEGVRAAFDELITKLPSKK